MYFNLDKLRTMNQEPGTRLAVIFDMDGVMVDNFEYHYRAWLEFLNRHGLEITRDQLRNMFFGRGNHEIFEILFGKDITKARSDALSEEKEQLYREIYSSEVVLVNGLEQFLNNLLSNHFPTAIATSAPRENVDFVLQETRLIHPFSAIIDSSKVKKAKPDPEIYLAAADGIGMDPDRCIVMEDSRNGILSAQRAGMKVVALTTSHSRDDLPQVDLVIDDFTGITTEDLRLMINDF